MSALLTTTMPYMKVVIDTLNEKSIRDDDVVLVGGAPLNEAFAEAMAIPHQSDPYPNLARAIELPPPPQPETPARRRRVRRWRGTGG